MIPSKIDSKIIFNVYSYEILSSQKIDLIYENSKLNEKIEMIEHKVLSVMTWFRKNRRPSCQQILEMIKEWTIDKSSLLKDDSYKEYLKKFLNEQEYFYDILR